MSGSWIPRTIAAETDLDSLVEAGFASAAVALFGTYPQISHRM